MSTSRPRRRRDIFPRGSRYDAGSQSQNERFATPSGKMGFASGTSMVNFCWTAPGVSGGAFPQPADALLTARADRRAAAMRSALILGQRPPALGCPLRRAALARFWGCVYVAALCAASDDSSRARGYDSSAPDAPDAPRTGDSNRPPLDLCRRCAAVTSPRRRRAPAQTGQSAPRIRGSAAIQRPRRRDSSEEYPAGGAAICRRTIQRVARRRTR